MILAILSLVAALAAEPAPKAEVERVRYILPNISLWKPSPAAQTGYIGGGVRVSFGGFSKASVHCLVLHVSCLCEQNGALVCYHGFWDKLNTYERLMQSDVAKVFKDMGVKLTGETRKSMMNDPKAFTPYLPEVLRDRYSMICTYGDPKQKGRGFFRLSKLIGPTKLLLVHLEVWQNGTMIGEYESSHTGLGKYGLPSDWHFWKKYPQKFKYVDAL